MHNILEEFQPTFKVLKFHIKKLGFLASPENLEDLVILGLYFQMAKLASAK